MEVRLSVSFIVQFPFPFEEEEETDQPIYSSEPAAPETAPRTEPRPKRERGEGGREKGGGGSWPLRRKVVGEGRFFFAGPEGEKGKEKKGGGGRKIAGWGVKKSPAFLGSLPPKKGKKEGTAGKKVDRWAAGVWSPSPNPAKSNVVGEGETTILKGGAGGEEVETDLPPDSARPFWE